MLVQGARGPRGCVELLKAMGFSAIIKPMCGGPAHPRCSELTGATAGGSVRSARARGGAGKHPVSATDITQAILAIFTVLAIFSTARDAMRAWRDEKIGGQ